MKEEGEMFACLQCGGEMGLTGTVVVLLLSVEPGQQEVLPGPDDQTVAQAVHSVLQGVHHVLSSPGRHVTSQSHHSHRTTETSEQRNNELQLQHAQRIFLSSAGYWQVG